MLGNPKHERPSVTLCWAQSLDGSVAVRRGERTRISGEASLAAMHRLRSEHDAILVGVGTVLSDDPRLNVRLVAGPDPQPVVLDSGLRTPAGSVLVGRSDMKPWIFAPPNAPAERRASLEGKGCRIIDVGVGDDGRLDLAEVLARLADRGISSLMVEGGGAVLASFIRSRLVDRIVVTIEPRFMGGYNIFTQNAGGWFPLDLADPAIAVHGQDIVIDGAPRWPEREASMEVVC